MPRFACSTRIEAPVEVVFAFHEKPEALETLTPPGQKIEIIRRTGGIQPGSEVEFRVRLGPFWLRWHARHTGYEKNRLFTDEQVAGPFRTWIHRHRFEQSDGGTDLIDEVEYSLPGGAPADALLGWLVRIELARLFAFRHRVTKRIAERMHRQAGRERVP